MKKTALMLTAILITNNTNFNTIHAKEKNSIIINDKIETTTGTAIDLINDTIYDGVTDIIEGVKNGTELTFNETINSNANNIVLRLPSGVTESDINDIEIILIIEDTKEVKKNIILEFGEVDNVNMVIINQDIMGKFSVEYAYELDSLNINTDDRLKTIPELEVDLKTNIDKFKVYLRNDYDEAQVNTYNVNIKSDSEVNINEIRINTEKLNCIVNIENITVNKRFSADNRIYDDVTNTYLNDCEVILNLTNVYANETSDVAIYDMNVNFIDSEFYGNTGVQKVTIDNLYFNMTNCKTNLKLNDDSKDDDYFHLYNNNYYLCIVGIENVNIKNSELGLIRTGDEFGGITCMNASIENSEITNLSIENEESNIDIKDSTINTNLIVISYADVSNNKITIDNCMLDLKALYISTEFWREDLGNELYLIDSTLNIETLPKWDYKEMVELKTINIKNTDINVKGEWNFTPEFMISAEHLTIEDSNFNSENMVLLVANQTSNIHNNTFDIKGVPMGIVSPLLAEDEENNIFNISNNIFNVENSEKIIFTLGNGSLSHSAHDVPKSNIKGFVSNISNNEFNLVGTSTDRQVGIGVPYGMPDVYDKNYYTENVWHTYAIGEESDSVLKYFGASTVYNKDYVFDKNKFNFINVDTPFGTSIENFETTEDMKEENYYNISNNYINGIDYENIGMAKYEPYIIEIDTSIEYTYKIESEELNGEVLEGVLNGLDKIEIPMYSNYEVTLTPTNLNYKEQKFDLNILKNEFNTKVKVRNEIKLDNIETLTPEIDVQRPSIEDLETLTPEVDVQRPSIEDLETLTPEVDVQRPSIEDLETLTPEVDVQRPSIDNIETLTPEIDVLTPSEEIKIEDKIKSSKNNNNKNNNNKNNKKCLLTTDEVVKLLEENRITEEEALQYYICIIKSHYDFDSYEVFVNTPFINIIKDNKVKTVEINSKSYVNNETYSTMVDLNYLEKISNKEVLICNNIDDKKATVLFDGGKLEVEYNYNKNIININGIEIKMLNRFEQALNTKLNDNNLMIPLRFFNEFLGFDVKWQINKAVVTNIK